MGKMFIMGKDKTLPSLKRNGKWFIHRPKSSALSHVFYVGYFKLRFLLS